jgi:hypothetical protein
MLTTAHPFAAVPPSVTIPVGANSATFTVTTSPVTSPTSGAVTARYGGTTASETLTVRPMGVGLLVLGPNPVMGGTTAFGIVALECAAGPGAIPVTLTSSNAAVAAPATSSLVIPAGSTSQFFLVNTAAVTAVTPVTLAAVAGGFSQTAMLTVRP